MDPLKIYSDQYDHEQLLKRDDQERVVAARMIADLAVLQPDSASSSAGERRRGHLLDPREMPSPHANGLRALAGWSRPGHRAAAQVADPTSPYRRRASSRLPGGVGRGPERHALHRLAQGRAELGVLEKALTRRDPKLE